MSLEDEIARMKAQLAELEAKAEAERLAKEEELKNPLTATFTRFSKATGTMYLKLSKFDQRAVDKFRKYVNRRFSGEENVFSGTDVPDLLSDLDSLSIPYDWGLGVKESWDEWWNLPDVTVEKGKSVLKLTLGPKVRDSRMYLTYELNSLSFSYTDKTYTLAIAQAYMLPGALESRYPTWNVVYSDEAKQIVFEQLEKRKRLAEIATATDIPGIPSPFIEPFDLKGHQRVATAFAKETNFRCIVGYDMGLGKSPIAMAIAEMNDFKKCLIICPASLKTNWKREIKKFTDSDAVVLSGVEPDALQLDLLLANHKYYIINYDILARSIITDKGQDKKDDLHVSKWAIFLNAAKFDIVFMDEAHYAKNLESKRSVAVRQLQVPRIIPMSGTPLVNRRSELFVLLHLIDPQAFPSFTQFDNIASRGDKALRDMLASYMIRRSFTDIYGKEMEPNRIKFTKELSPTAQKHYDMVMQGIYASLKRPDYQLRVTSILSELMRCKQITSQDNCQTTADMAIDAADETEKKVLIFSQFKDSQHTIATWLGHEAAVVNGDVKDDARYELVDKFQDSSSSLKFIVTNILEGLTLTEAHTVIFNDLWWTPKDHRQAEGRAFGRTNDPHSGNSYYIQNEGTIDEFINALLIEKMAVFTSVVDGTITAQKDQGDIIQALINHLRGKS